MYMQEMIVKDRNFGVLVMVDGSIRNENPLAAMNECYYTYQRTCGF